MYPNPQLQSNASHLECPKDASGMTLAVKAAFAISAIGMATSGTPAWGMSEDGAQSVEKATPPATRVCSASIPFDGAQVKHLPVQMVVEGGTQSDEAMACSALKKAMVFWLSRVSLDLLSGQSIKIKFVDELPSQGLAVYGVKEKMVFARADLVSSLQGQKIFGMPATPSLVESVLVHEMSHALTEHFYKELENVGVEDEYAAFVAQIESMDPQDKARVVEFSSKTIRSIPKESDFDSLSYALHRQTFGLMAHRHYTSEKGGDAFLEKIFDRSFVAPRAMMQ
jgi:hypothetical protein